MPAPKATASRDEHRRHADETLADDKYKKPPKDRRLETDIPPEGENDTEDDR